MRLEFAKIKGAEIIVHAKSPTFKAAKLKGFTVIYYFLFAITARSHLPELLHAKMINEVVIRQLTHNVEQKRFYKISQFFTCSIRVYSCLSLAACDHDLDSTSCSCSRHLKCLQRLF